MMLFGSTIPVLHSAVAESMAAQQDRVWLTRVDEPNRPLHRALIHHTRPAGFASAWSRFAQFDERRDPIAAFFQTSKLPAHTGWAGLCALNQGKQRKHA